MSALTAAKVRTQEIAFIGNPNSGKTTLFNALTGLSQTTGNYPGVTVEKKVGRLNLPNGIFSALDLPGTYSLLPRSPDEQVVHDVLIGIQKGTPKPDALLMVVDANNLERNMYLLTQTAELGIPMVIALTMCDLAKDHGISIDSEVLGKTFNAPCVPVLAHKRKGIDELKRAMQKQLTPETALFPQPVDLHLPAEVKKELEGLCAILDPWIPGNRPVLQAEALRLLSDIDFGGIYFRSKSASEKLHHETVEARNRLAFSGIDWSSVEAESRYACIDRICPSVISVNKNRKRSFSETMDNLLTHRIWGLVSFALIMGTVFQSIFTWAAYPMDLVAGAIEGLSAFVGGVLPPGQLNSLVVDGMIAGVGNVIIFLPQIFLLFFFIAFLEDLGYMARAAFVLDRIMSKVGLNGKAFLPLLSSFACAIPGIMATRTIEQKNDRLATIMVAPLMSCSARLPVYALMIGAFIPAVHLFGIFNLKGITLFSMYFLSLFAGLGMAALFRKTLLRGEKTPFIFELPPYRMPHFKNLFLTTWHRGSEFLYRAGTIIFCISILLWFLVSYPAKTDKDPSFETARQTAAQTIRGEELENRLQVIDREEAGEHLRNSYAGRMGRFIEPVIEPLGFDWKLGIGIVGSFAAREVLVSTLAIVYNVGRDADEKSVDLIMALKGEKDDTGKRLYTPLTAVSLMVFYVLACQCMSTIAIVRRETNSWSWPLLMITYMTALAWVGSFTVYQGGHLLGFQ